MLILKRGSCKSAYVAFNLSAIDLFVLHTEKRHVVKNLGALEVLDFDCLEDLLMAISRRQRVLIVE